MQDGQAASVFECEFAALREASNRNAAVFTATGESKTVWIVAGTEHQARISLSEYIWPIQKMTKRERIARHLELCVDLLDKAAAERAEADQTGGDFNE